MECSFEDWRKCEQGSRCGGLVGIGCRMHPIGCIQDPLECWERGSDLQAPLGQTAVMTDTQISSV